MTNDDEVVTIRVFYWRDTRHELEVSGPPSGNATDAILRKIYDVRGEDYAAFREDAAEVEALDIGFPLVFAGESPDDPTGGFQVEFVQVGWTATFEEVQRIVGPRAYSATVAEAGFGGDGIEDFVLWTINDLAPFGAELAELYGYAEIVRRVGSAMRRRKYRNKRRAAERWVIEGGPVPVVVRHMIDKDDMWALDQLRQYLGVTTESASKLMAELGYEWEPESRSFYAPPDLDAVN